MYALFSIGPSAARGELAPRATIAAAITKKGKVLAYSFENLPWAKMPFLKKGRSLSGQSRQTPDAPETH